MVVNDSHIKEVPSNDYKQTDTNVDNGCQAKGGHNYGRQAKEVLSNDYEHQISDNMICENTTNVIKAEEQYTETNLVSKNVMTENDQGSAVCSPENKEIETKNSMNQRLNVENTNNNNSGSLTQNKFDDFILLPHSTHFLRAKYFTLISQPAIRILVFIIYIALMATAIYGLVTTETGVHLPDTAQRDSPIARFTRGHKRHFASYYGPTVIVAIDETLDYTNDATLGRIENIIDKFRRNQYFESDPNLLKSWIRDFNIYLTERNLNINDLTMSEFIRILRNDFFIVDSTSIIQQHYSLDVTFNRDFTNITSSRFYIQSGSLLDSKDRQNMMNDARKIADDSSYSITVFAPEFIYWDSGALVFNNAMLLTGLSALSMLYVAIFLVPDISAIICSAFAVVSINVFILGFVSLWSINLSTLSLLYVIISVGFTVSFVSHMISHIAFGTSKDTVDNIINALSLCGAPVFWTTVALTVATAFLAITQSYVLVIFSKQMFLSMMSILFHVLVILPVVLLTVKPVIAKLNCTKRSYEIN